MIRLVGLVGLVGFDEIERGRQMSYLLMLDLAAAGTMKLPICCLAVGEKLLNIPSWVLVLKESAGLSGLILSRVHLI